MDKLLHMNEPLMIKFIFKFFIDKDQIDFIAKLFAMSVYADEKVNALELNELKRDIKIYIDTYYSMLSPFFKKELTEFLYQSVLTIISKMKRDEKYIEFFKKDIIYEIKLMKEKKEFQKLEFILQLVKKILISDKIFTEEEKEFFKTLENLIAGEKNVIKR